jgi:hypothetical protein
LPMHMMPPSERTLQASLTPWGCISEEKSARWTPALRRMSPDQCDGDVFPAGHVGGCKHLAAR